MGRSRAGVGPLHSKSRKICLTMNSASLAFALLMFVAGLGIPAIAAMNADVGERLSNPVAAVFLMALVLLIASSALLALKGIPSLEDIQAIPTMRYGAGLLYLLYIVSITIAAPKIGLGNAIFVVLFGQLVAATTIDNFGLLGSDVSPVGLKRILGLVLMAVGIFLAGQGSTASTNS